MKQEIVKIKSRSECPYVDVFDDSEYGDNSSHCEITNFNVTSCENNRHPQCPLNDKQIILVGA
jgi:hypothetical protein